MTAAPTLTPRALNRALLGRQLLLAPARLSIPAALDAMAGLQAQYAPSMYVGLWSRLDGFDRSQLTAALEARTVVQGTLLRSTIHLVSAGDYWPFALAVRAARRRWWLRAWRHEATEEELEEAAARLRPRLAEAPMRVSEVDALVGRRMRTGVGLWLDLVRVPPSGTWERRRADLYAAAEDWLGPPPPDLTPEAAVERLVRRYLGGFGPSRRAEIADWAGLPVGEVRPVLERLDLRRFRDEEGEELVDLPGARLPGPETPAPVRFLPVWDASLLVHARRKLVLAEEHRPLIFNTRTPHSVPTFLVDGTVAGTWRYERGRVQVSPFQPLDPAVQAEVEAGAERLAAFHA